MPQVIVVGYDGSDSANRALDFAMDRAKAQGGSVHIVHVLEWSAYSFLTPTELEERHARRKDELARAEEAVIKPAIERASKAGVPVDTAVKYGHSAEVLCKVAKDLEAGQIVIGRTGQSSLSSRLFGSVAGSLAQVAPVPVTIVP